MDMTDKVEHGHHARVEKGFVREMLGLTTQT